MTYFLFATSHFEQAGVAKPLFTVLALGTYYYVMQY